MAKEIKAKVKFRLPAGGATPAPPVGSVLGQHGVNLMDFCKKFNADTADKKGQIVPVKVTIYKDKTYEYETKTPPATDLIKKKSGIAKGSSVPHKDKVGKISWADIEEIAKIKMADLNALDLDQARKIIAGSARSMGIEVVD